MLVVAATAGMVEDLEPDVGAMRTAATRGYATATDLADWLVQALGLPFRHAHHVTGRVVARAEALGVGLEALPLAELQAVEPRITAEAQRRLSIDASVASRTVYGGTAPQNVEKAARDWLQRLAGPA
jgi:argininosuccinate lyase